MAKMPLTRELIKQQILQLLGKEFPAGSVLPTGNELAQRLGTGRRNTQQAVTELAKEGFLDARPRRGTFVAHDIDRLLHRLPWPGPLSGKRVSILAQYPRVPFLRRIIQSLVRALRASGAAVSVQRVSYTRSLNLDLLSSQPSDGFVLINPDSTLSLRSDARRPVVVISTTSVLAEILDTRVSVVSVDDEHGGRLAGAALKARGCESACFIGVRDRQGLAYYEDVSTVRLRGFEAGFGSAVDEPHRLSASSFSDMPGARAAAAYLRLNPRPRGVFAANDEIAYGFALGAMAHGLEPQRDFYLVGFDGQFLTQYNDLAKQFSTVAVPKIEMGRAAASILAKRFAQPESDPQRAQLTCHFVAERAAWRPLPAEQRVPSESKNQTRS